MITNELTDEEMVKEFQAAMDAIEEIQCDPDLSDFRDRTDLPPLSDRWAKILQRCTGINDDQR